MIGRDFLGLILFIFRRIILVYIGGVFFSCIVFFCKDVFVISFDRWEYKFFVGE